MSLIFMKHAGYFRYCLKLIYFFLDNDTGTILGLEITWFVVVVVSTVLVLLVLIVAAVICICRKNWNTRPTAQQPNASYSRKFYKYLFIWV